jgi:anti-sigma factor RsiW
MRPDEDQPVRDEDLHAYVDDCLAPDHRAIVAQRLRENPDTAARAADYGAQRDGLRAALGGIADEPLPPRLDLNALIARREMQRRSTWRMAAAVVLALGLGGSGGWLLHGAADPPPNAVAELVREAVANHVVYTADLGRPTEFGADQRADLSRWVSDRLKLPVTLPDLSASGFRFMGGRLAATPEGAAGMFMYRDARVVWLTVFMRPFPGAPSAQMRAVYSGGLDGCAWIEKGVGYMVVGRLPQAEVWNVARQVQRQMAAPI